MSSGSTARVALLYVHPLLGEGIAAYLRQSVEADVVTASVDDRDAVAFILRSQPDVIVFEASPALDLARLSRLVPDATLIDVSPATASGDLIPPQGSAPCIETIVRAIAPDATAHAS
jgi:DNA-binding NarL/FixJ family response regulator